MPTLAILNPDNVLVGYEVVTQDRYDYPQVGEIPCPDNCDLEPHKYKWDGEKFIPQNIQVYGQHGPRTALAMYQGFEFLINFIPAVVATMKMLDDNPNVTLPKKAKDWLDAWESGDIEPPRSLIKWIQHVRKSYEG
jgi:hypothetical protein